MDTTFSREASGAWPAESLESLPDALSNVDPALRRAWHPIAWSRDVTSTPQKVWLLGEAYVAVRIGEEAVVLRDECPHRLAPLSAGSVVNGALQCAYHGWRFAADGSCLAIPSLGSASHLPPRSRCARPWGVVERYGLVFVAPDEPLVELPDVPAFADEERRRVDCTPFHGTFGAGFLIDNQLDLSHFAFLHASTFGSAEAAVTPAYEVHKEMWGFRVEADIPILAANDPAVGRGERPLAQHRHMRYRYRVPFALELRLDYPMMGGSTVITFFVQPETATTATMYVSLLFEQPGGFSDEELSERVAFEYRVISEDLALQERFDALALPLELSRECHVRADRASVEYRRQLTGFVIASRLAGQERGIEAVGETMQVESAGGIARRA